MLNSISIGRDRWSRYKHTWQPLKNVIFWLSFQKFSGSVHIEIQAIFKDPSTYALTVYLCLLNYYFIRCDLYCSATLMITDYKTKVIGFIHLQNLNYYVIQHLFLPPCMYRNTFLRNTKTNFIQYSCSVFKNATFCSM